jgi:hypothetical protein
MQHEPSRSVKYTWDPWKEANPHKQAFVVCSSTSSEADRARIHTGMEKRRDICVIGLQK